MHEGLRPQFHPAISANHRLEQQHHQFKLLALQQTMHLQDMGNLEGKVWSKQSKLLLVVVCIQEREVLAYSSNAKLCDFGPKANPKILALKLSHLDLRVQLCIHEHQHPCRHCNLWLQGRMQQLLQLLRTLWFGLIAPQQRYCSCNFPKMFNIFIARSGALLPTSGPLAIFFERKLPMAFLHQEYLVYYKKGSLAAKQDKILMLQQLRYTMKLVPPRLQFLALHSGLFPWQPSPNELFHYGPSKQRDACSPCIVCT